MRLIHNHLAKLADCCLTGTHNRFSATTGVNLECKEHGYIAVATDGRRMIVVEGEYPPVSAEFPTMPSLDAAPNGKTQAVIPAKAWKETMTKAVKATKKAVKPIMRENVAVVMGEQVTTFGATDMESETVATARNVEGRFLNWRCVLPDESKAKAVVSFDPKLMAELLTAVASIGCDEESKRVELRLYGDHTPMTITSRSPNRPHTTGVLVPLLPNGQNVNRTPARDHERDKLLQRLDRTVAALRKVQAERDNLALQLKPVARCNADIAAFVDPDGALQAAGLVKVQ